MELDWEKVVTGLSGLGAAVLLVWNRVLATRTKTATASAEVSQAGQARAEAVAGETVFSLVTQRLQAVESELTQVRGELSKVRDQLQAKDNEVHKLRMHIVDLEHCLRQHGIESIPTMRD